MTKQLIEEIRQTATQLTDDPIYLQDLSYYYRMPQLCQAHVLPSSWPIFDDLLEKIYIINKCIKKHFPYKNIYTPTEYQKECIKIQKKLFGGWHLGDHYKTSKTITVLQIWIKHQTDKNVIFKVMKDFETDDENFIVMRYVIQTKNKKNTFLLISHEEQKPIYEHMVCYLTRFRYKCIVVGREPKSINQQSFKIYIFKDLYFSFE